MAASTTPITQIDAKDREILDLFKEGVGIRPIAMRVRMEPSEVQETVNILAGGDRARAGAVLAAYDRAHGTTPVGAPKRGGRHATPRPTSDGVARFAADLPLDPPPTRKAPTPATRKPRAAAQQVDTTPAAPTVVPVDLTNLTPADTPAPAPTTSPTVDAAPPGTGLARVAELVAGADTERQALVGPTDPLPAVKSLDDLLAGAGNSGSPHLTRLASQIRNLLEQLHAGYDRERKTREVRAQAAELRRELDSRLALLARLEAGGEPQTDTPAAAAAA